ncbi:MAG: peptide deformylase, partial [bacterium]
TYINPTLRKPDGPLCTYEEGGLSLPDIRGDVLRPEIITVDATDLQGQRFTLRAAGLLARCIQHEFDHLPGTLSLDRMTQGARLKSRTKVKALEAGQ